MKRIRAKWPRLKSLGEPLLGGRRRLAELPSDPINSLGHACRSAEGQGAPTRRARLDQGRSHGSGGAGRTWTTNISDQAPPEWIPSACKKKSGPYRRASAAIAVPPPFAAISARSSPAMSAAAASMAFTHGNRAGSHLRARIAFRAITENAIIVREIVYTL